MLLVEVPLEDQLPSKSATLISLATMWVNILLRKAVKIKHLSWAYVLRILSSKAASTFDELFTMSIQSSQEEIVTQVFSSVLQTESLQDELFDILKAFAQTCIAKGGVLPLQDLKVTISSDIMETSGLKTEFESLMKGEYERVLKVYTITDKLGEPPHLTAYLTVSVDKVHISEKLGGHSSGDNQSLENCRGQHTPHASSRGKSTAMEELQVGECPTTMTRITNGTISMGSEDPSPNMVEQASRKPLALKTDLDIDKTSNTADDQNRNVPNYESTAQPKPMVTIHSKPIEPEGGLSSKLDIQVVSFNSSITGIETESATSLCMYSGVKQNSGQPHSVRNEMNDPCKELAISHYKPSSSLPPPLLHSGELLVCPMKHETGSTAEYGLPPPILSEECNEPLLCHVKQPVTQGLNQIPEAKGSVPGLNDIISSPTSGPSQPHSWRADLLKHCSSLASLKSFIQSLPPEVLALKDDVQGKTICHALVGLCDEGFTSCDVGFTSCDVIHLLELFDDYVLQQCMLCQDSSGNTPLHCSVDVHNPNTDVVEFLSRFTSSESLLLKNNNNLTPIDISFKMSFWSATQMLIERQIKTGASCAELLQQYVLKAAKKEGGANVLSQLLDLRERYCPDLNLNFGSSESSYTPWWYLVNSTSDVNAMNRVLEALRDHSIALKSLLTHTDGETNLVEEAMEKNKALFNKIGMVAGLQHNEEEQDVRDQEGLNIYGLPESLPRGACSYSSLTPPSSNEQSSSDQNASTVELWLSQCDGVSLKEGRDCHKPNSSSSDQHEFPNISPSSGIETDGQRWLPNEGMTIFKSRQPKAAIFTHLSSSESEGECEFPRQHRCMAISSFSGMEAGGQRLPNKGTTMTIFRQPKTATYTNASSSESEVDCMGCHELSSLSRPSQRSLPAVARDELTPDNLPLDTNTIPTQEQYFESTTELPSPEEPSNLVLQPAQTGSQTPTKLLCHMKQPVTHLTQIPEAKKEDVSVPSFKYIMLSSPTSTPSQPHSWRADLLKHCSSLASLKSFIHSLPPEVLALKDDVQGKTICHALVGLCDEGFTSCDVIHLLELFDDYVLQQCMLCQDSSGNTPLHCSVDVHNPNTDVVEFLLRFTSRESLPIANNNNLTPSDISFEKSFWSITQMLIERQIKTGASCAELLQQYVLKAAKKEGGANVLSQLLDLRERYCPDLNLNFGSSESSYTPWWYLVNSTSDVNAMNRVLQALRDHSIAFKSLLTRTDGETNLVEEAMEKNKALFNKIQVVAGLQHNEEDQDVCDQEGLNISGLPESLPQTFGYPILTTPSSKIAHDQSKDISQVRLQLWLSQCGESFTEGTDCHIPDSSSAAYFRLHRPNANISRSLNFTYGSLEKLKHTYCGHL